MKMTVKEFIGVALTIIGFIGVTLCIAGSLVFAITNPDMTEMRRLMEYPETIIAGIISLLIIKFGIYLVNSDLWRK